MIKIYIFITGLVLYQFPSTQGGKVYAVLAAGGYEYPGLAEIPSHEIVLFWNEDIAPKAVAQPLDSRLIAPCPEVGCTLLSPPSGIHDFRNLLESDRITPKLQSKCTSLADNKGCHPPGLSSTSARSGLLVFEGGWSMLGMSDCGGNSFPSLIDGLPRLNYIRAGQSWKLRYDAGDLPQAGSTIMFAAQVDSMEDLEITNTLLADSLKVRESQDCLSFPGFQTSGASKCAVLVIRNGATGTPSRAGDIHHAALFALLENPPEPGNIWLPISAGHDVCRPGGGGTGGTSHCTSLLVVGD